MSGLRILFVVHGFPPQSVAGTEIHNLALARELHKNNTVSVYARMADAATPDYATRTEKLAGLRVRWVNNALRGAWDTDHSAT